MAFSIPGSHLFNNDNNSAHPGTTDSIQLGQQRPLMPNAIKAREQIYDFHYDDEDTVINEINEFFAYVETTQTEENHKSWEGSFQGEWTRTAFNTRKAHINYLLEGMEHKDTMVRFTNARRLFYVLQGAFAETSSQEHQLHWIIENCKVVRAANGMSIVLDALKLANQRHDLLTTLSDEEAFRIQLSPADKQELIEEVNTELSIYLGILYLLVEVLKDTDEFADDLMSTEPPLPIFLFNVVAGLREKSFRGYPVKKLLLLQWKTILACWGGSRNLKRVKRVARELDGLPEEVEEGIPIKSSPFDLQVFRQETSTKYPTFLPPCEASTIPIVLENTVTSHTEKSTITLSPLKLAEAFSPIPVRHHYHHGDDTDFQQNTMSSTSSSSQPMYNIGNPVYNPNPSQMLTPAPTPPPSPKPKKQQYQTDQSRPFLFPFSRSQVRSSRGVDQQFVPFAISEADRLYAKHMHVSASLLQMWRTREECMIEESGLQKPGERNSLFETFDSVLSLNSHKSDIGTSILEKKVEGIKDDAEDSSLSLFDKKIADIERQIREIELDRRKTGTRQLIFLQEKREDLLRLKRVEMIYSAVLPNLNNWVVVLLKMLLATVSVNNLNQPPPSASSGAFPPGVEQSQVPAPPPTLEEIDLLRHREVMSKAVSAILLLTLQWFKASHAMKFHYLGQLLLDNNCLLLILKMFTIQEVASSISSKADSCDNNFFQFCLRFSKQAQGIRPEDAMLSRPHASGNKGSQQGNNRDEIELITDFSWRNFFSSINFVRIMQKLSKHRSHRILLLVQYKSSAVLKRNLKVSHPLLQLYVLKLIKSQVPYCGRKWRQSNMKVITTIYLNCRPDLRDEWLTGTEVDDAQDALAQEQALRKLVKFYNNKRYGVSAVAASSHNSHRRSSSMSMPLNDLHAGPELSAISRPIGTPNVAIDPDVFPPVRAQAPDPSIFLPYTTEDIAFEEEYEEYLSDLGMSTEQVGQEGTLFGGTSAWHRLPLIGPEIADGISDSESIVSIGELGEVAKFDSGSDSDRDSVDENRNNWEHMSPKTMAALPKSPVGHRRSSSGSNLRPILPFGLDDSSAVNLDEIDDEAELGPMPREQAGPFAQGGGVDEVEYAYGL